MLADDILELENLMGSYMFILGTGRWDLVPPCFADDPEVSSQISPFRPTNVGKENLMNATFYSMNDAFPDYDSFHTGGQIGVPLIEICGDHAWGCFPSLGFLVLGRVFGNPDPPYTLSAAFGMWSHEFLKEGGRWKFLHFHAPTLFEQRSWSWDPAHSDDLAGRGKIKTLPLPPGIQTENRRK